MMGAAKATYIQAWQVKMNELKKADYKAWEWLSNVPTKVWLARDKPILTMCEWIRTYLMNKISTIRSKLGKWQHAVMPMPRKRLNVEVEKAGNWIATWGNNLEFEVEEVGGARRFSVDLTKRSCSYMWPDIEYEEMLPPVYKRTPGRPKKLRRRGADEPRPGKWSRRIHGGGPTNRCTTCNQEGHNAKSCKSDTIDPKAAKRKRKPKRTATSTAQATTTAQTTTTSQAPTQAIDESAAPATDEATTQSKVQATIQATTHSSAQATNEAATQPTTQTTLETPIAVSSLNATHEPPTQDEVVSKKRKLTAQFKPPAQIKPKPVNPTLINPKPVNPTSINPKPINHKPAVIIKPSAHINTNVKNVYKKPAHVKTPSGSIKYGPTNVTVNPSAHVDSVVKPWPPVRPFELKKPKLEYPKLDLSKVRRSSRNIFKTNNNGPGKDKDYPIEILDEDDVGDGVLTQEQIDDGNDGTAKVGPCLKTLRKIEAGEYMM
ncbi:hypothetical protein P8452_48048 [Trifolium repens]|nr:hypothetical protein P8452_48048 [Trifolium repens]